MLGFLGVYCVLGKFSGAGKQILGLGLSGLSLGLGLYLR